MATKKSVLVLSTILVISAWILGFAIQAGAETLKGKIHPRIINLRTEISIIP
jgi:hypothetical protein